MLVLEKRQGLSNRHSIWIFGTDQNGHMTSANSQIRATAHTRSISDAHRSTTIEPREAIIASFSVSFLSGRFVAKPGPVRSKRVLPTHNLVPFFSRCKIGKGEVRGQKDSVIPRLYFWYWPVIGRRWLSFLFLLQTVESIPQIQSR